MPDHTESAERLAEDLRLVSEDVPRRLAAAFRRLLTVRAAAERVRTRRRRLRRMKAGATALLAIALAVFVATFFIPGATQSVQFLRAASEAAMVGGIADWFAVTALFRHPLGLPIPHTALIPNQKENLAGVLGEFMTTYFLEPQVVLDHLMRADVIGRAGTWLADPVHAQAVSMESAAVLAAFIETAGPQPIVTAAMSAVRTDMRRRSYAAQAGEFLAITVDDRAHVPIVDILLRQSAEWLRREEDNLFVPVKRLIESNGVWAWLYITSRRSRRLIRDFAALVDRVLEDHDHDLRAAIDRLLANVADELRTDSPLARGIDTASLRVLEDERTKAWLTDLIGGTLTALDRTLTDPQSAPVRSFAALLRDWGQRATDDERFRLRLTAFLGRVLEATLKDHADEFTRFVADTVAQWDARQTVDRIEVAVGRDLQYIRINGTVVGAVAGITIHAASLLLP